MSTKTTNELYLELSPEIRDSIEKKFYEYYKQEKENSVLFIPLYSGLIMEGNHFQPLISFQEHNCLAKIGRDFNSAYIYPGYSTDMEKYITEEYYENMLPIVSMYNNLFNKSAPYSSTKSEQLAYFINLFTRIQEDGITSLPSFYTYNIFEDFNTLFCKGLDETLEQIETVIKQKDKKITPVVILPRENIYKCNYETEEDGINKTAQNIEKVKNFADKTNAKIFLSCNNGGKDISPDGIALRLYESVFDNEFPVIKGADDFATEYSKMIVEEIKEAIQFDTLIEGIANGEYGDTENSIIENLKNINLNQPTTKPTQYKKDN